MKLTVPFYLHKAGAGFPSPATDYIEEDVDLNVHLIKNVPAPLTLGGSGGSPYFFRSARPSIGCHEGTTSGPYSKVLVTVNLSNVGVHVTIKNINNLPSPWCKKLFGCGGACNDKIHKQRSFTIVSTKCSSMGCM